MKKILSILLTLSALTCFAQPKEYPLTIAGNVQKAMASKLEVDSILYMPVYDTAKYHPTKIGATLYQASAKSFYTWDVYWRKLGSGVDTVYRRADSLFFKKNNLEYFFTRVGVSTITVPSGLSVTRNLDSAKITTALNGVVVGTGSGLTTGVIDSPFYYTGGHLGMYQAGNNSSGYLTYSDWRRFNSAITSSRRVNGGGSITGGGDLSVDRTLTLANDVLSPGNLYYYGTNSVGTKGWFLLPPGAISSVGLSMPTGFTVTGSPLTSNGTITVATSLNGVIYGNGSGLATAVVQSPLLFSAGNLSIQQASSSQSGYLGATDYTNFLSAYQKKTTSLTVTGSSTKTITLTTQDGSQYQANFTDLSTPQGSGITKLNGDSTSVQNFATGNSGTDFNIVSNLSGLTTFNIPSASATNRGVLASSDWSAFNSKIAPSDTTTMLAHYVNLAGFGLTKSGQIVSADTVKLATVYSSHHYSDSLAAGIKNIYTTWPLYAANDSTFAIQHSTDASSGYVDSIDHQHFNEAYNKYTVSGSLSGSTITYTRKDGSTWTVTGVGSGGGVTLFSQLGDVQITSPANNQVPVYTTASGLNKWTNQPIIPITLTNPKQGNVILYDSTSAGLVNASAQVIDTTGAANGKIATWQNGNLVLQTSSATLSLPANQIAYGTGSSVTSSNLFQFNGTNQISLGTSIATVTATPMVLDMGATYSNSAGVNPKLKLFNDGTTVYGIGVSNTQLDFINTYSGSTQNFYIGGTKQLSISNTAVTLNSLKSGNTPPASTGTTKMVITDANGQLSFAAIPTGGGGTGPVTSVSATGSNALSATVTNPTSTPAIALGWTGANTQYVLGDGTLATKITNNNQLTNGSGYISNTTGLISAGTNIGITGNGTSASPYVIANSITNDNQLTNGAGYITNATGLISAGNNINITGSGTAASPYVITNGITNNIQLTNGAGFLTNITGYVSAGTNVTITGSGTAASPYVINSATGGAGLSSSYTSFSDGTNVSSASGSDVFKIRSANNILSATVTDNDATYGDNVLFTVNQSNIDVGQTGGSLDWSRVTNKPTIPSATVTLGGDVAGTGSTGSTITTTLASVATAGSCTACNITIDAKGRTTAISSGVSIPSQTGNSGKFLTTNGSALSWGGLGTTNTVNSYLNGFGNFVTLRPDSIYFASYAAGAGTITASDNVRTAIQKLDGNFSNYYTKTNLQTSGQATVDWGNIANKPSFITTESDPVWTAAKPNYYTITNMNTSGQSLVDYHNLGNIGSGVLLGRNSAGSGGAELVSLNGYTSIQFGNPNNVGLTLMLAGDNGSPGANYYYGTNSASSKGWYALPASVTGISAGVGIAVSNSGSNYTVANNAYDDYNQWTTYTSGANASDQHYIPLDDNTTYDIEVDAIGFGTTGADYHYHAVYAVKRINGTGSLTTTGVTLSGSGSLSSTYSAGFSGTVQGGSNFQLYVSNQSYTGGIEWKVIYKVNKINIPF